MRHRTGACLSVGMDLVVLFRRTVGQHCLATLLSLCCMASEALATDSAAGDWYLDAARVPTEVTVPSGQPAVVIAIVDDGFRLSHQDLQGFIRTNPGEIPANGIDDDGNGAVDDVQGWDVSDQDNDVEPAAERVQEYYHGTHLAGVVTRAASRAFGGKARDLIQLLPVKAVSDQATRTYVKDGYKGIEYAINAGADIIISAWGVGHISAQEEDILERARRRGVLIVASAGNVPQDIAQYPAAQDGVLAVAALDHQGRKSGLSSYGDFVDLAAPGVDIQSASSTGDNRHAVRQGSSQSAALVAVAAAMVKLSHPSRSARELVACLKQSADLFDTTDSRFAAKLGAGTLNVAAAMRCDLLRNSGPQAHQPERSQGYLRLHSSPGAQTMTWDIAPKGAIEGFEFKSRHRTGSFGGAIVNFYTGDSAQAQPVKRYPLSELPESVYLAGTTVRVTLELPRAGNDLDTLLEYRPRTIDVSRQYCDGTVRLDAEGSIEDGSGANDYAFNTDCKWLITAPPGKVVRLRFTQFDTQPRTDLLYFFNGTGTHEKIMAMFSGPDLPPVLRTWSNQVLVWFVTNDARQGRGWQMEYRFEDP